ncbi:Bud site selection protein BUD4 [Colletotrichum sp. SAR 10_65]|nr:Bud site selection protein BUD4 [Colletotrichum sp. SAR 10_65]
MASQEDPVHPLRISKGSTGSTGSPPPKAANLPRALSELSPSDLRRNSPSFKQPSKKMTLNTDSSPFQSSPMETTTSPRLFWQKRNLDSISTETQNLYGGRHGSPSPTRRTSIERLQKASRVKNSNILALEQKQEYDPTRVPQIERPLANYSASAYGGSAAPTAIINGLRSSDSLSRGFGHQRNNSSKSNIPIYSPATSPTKASGDATPMQATFSSPPKSPGKEPGSPMKSSLSRSNFKSSFDPETGTWSADTSFDDRELPSGKSLHRHAKSVTFDAAPPQINEYEMATPDISSIGSNSREGSFDSMDDEDDDEEHYHLGDHDIGEDSFDASLEDTDKTPVVGPDDWRQSAERMEDPFESSPMPESLPARPGRPEHVRSDSSTSDHRPLPPLPGMGGSFTRSESRLSDSRGSPGISATAERMLGTHRSLPSPPPAAAAASKSEIQSIGNGKMTLEERLKLMMLSDDHKSASEQQRERRLRRGAQRDRFQSPSSETETAESSMLEADEEDDTIGDISALEDYELPTRISRESILRRVNTGETAQEAEYFSSPAPSSSPERPSPERRLPLPLDPDVPIPSTEDSILDDEVSDLSDEEGSVIIHRDEDTDAETESITDFYARSEDENDADSASHYSDGPARVPEVTEVDEEILTPRAASPQQAFQSFDIASEIRPLELKSDKTGNTPTESPVESPMEPPAKEPTPEPEEVIEPEAEMEPEIQEIEQEQEKQIESPASVRSGLPEMKDEAKENEFSKGLQSFMLPPPPEPTAQDLEELQPPPKMADVQAQRPFTPPQLQGLYDGSGWGEPEDEYDDEPGTPESVIHRPIEDSDEESDFEESMLEHPPSIAEEPLESPAIPERQATIKASGSKLKTRPSNTPSDIIAMREARRQVSREVPDIPPIPERHRNRLSRDLTEESNVGEDYYTQRHPSFKKRSLTLDLDFGLSLDQDFDRVIEQQKVAFSQQVYEASQIASKSLSRQASRPTASNREIIAEETQSQNANIKSRNQRGYLMRQNTKLVTASDKESDDKWKTRSAGNSPVKTDRPQSWTVEPWNGRPRQKSVRRSRAHTSGPAPPLPGQESNAHTLNPLAEEDLNPELATEESGERGRLFIKVLGVKDLDLPIPRNERTWFSLTLDNGVHCVTTAWLELARNAPIGQEFELVVPNDLEFQLTLNVKLEKPLPKKVVVQSSPTKASKPKTSTFSRVFASPKKRKEMELRAREEEERQAAQQREAQARQMKVAPSAWDLLSPLAAEDGSFARSYVCLKEHESRCYGRPYVVNVACFNEWATEEAAFASSVKSKRGSTAVVRRAPYKIGKLELQLLFVPRPKGATDDDMPKSMNSCIREIKAAEERLSKNWEGHLSQQGGDCPYWRRRYFKLVGTKLTAYHEATRQPRATINLANAKRLIDDRRALTEKETTGKGGRRRRSAFAEEEEGYMFVEEGFRIRFNNGELIDFYADTAEDKEGWMQALTDVVGRPEGGGEGDDGPRSKGKWCELVLKREDALRRRAEGRRVHSRTKSTFN